VHFKFLIAQRQYIQNHKAILELKKRIAHGKLRCVNSRN